MVKLKAVDGADLVVVAELVTVVVAMPTVLLGCVYGGGLAWLKVNGAAVPSRAKN